MSEALPRALLLLTTYECSPITYFYQFYFENPFRKIVISFSTVQLDKHEKMMSKNTHI